MSSFFKFDDLMELLPPESEPLEVPEALSAEQETNKELARQALLQKRQKTFQDSLTFQSRTRELNKRFFGV